MSAIGIGLMFASILFINGNKGIREKSKILEICHEISYNKDI